MTAPVYPVPQDDYEPFPITPDDVLGVMGIALPTQADRDWLEMCVEAVALFVGRYQTINALSDVTCLWAATQWSQRLYQRRGSASGIQSFDQGGLALYVSKYDPDIAQQLRVSLPRYG